VVVIALLIRFRRSQLREFELFRAPGAHGPGGHVEGVVSAQAIILKAFCKLSDDSNVPVKIALPLATAIILLVGCAKRAASWRPRTEPI
jgi:hypothetical protein